ncbi:MAG TPA: PfkB family carbohydrate kinase [Anaeromyxobacteraceae bacterium]|nr:PfkB family carbohydrate kinase [Anaeromyxobacteraceae bacterium]
MARSPSSPLAPLAPLLDRFPRSRVVVVGDFVADEYVYGETERISREAPVLIVRFERSEVVPGGAGNAAMNLAALGVEVRAVGLVGADGPGDRLLDELRDGGVDARGVQRVRGRVTEAKTRILAGGRSTRRQQMLRVDRTPEPISPAVERRLVAALERAARGAGAVLASDYGSGVLSPRVVEALRAVRRRGIPVCVDSRYNLAGFSGLTMLKPNEPELEAATGVRASTPEGLLRAARVLQRRTGCQSLLVTRGRNGMSLFEQGRPPVHLPAHGDKEAVDVTGAGDTVAAAYSAAIASGADPVSAMRLANVAAALVVQKPGTATVTRDEIRRELPGA